MDEQGSTEGIITLEDAIETLLGVEIVDELDSVDDMRRKGEDLEKVVLSRAVRWYLERKILIYGSEKEAKTVIFD